MSERYASVAEAVSSSTDVEEDVSVVAEVQELLQEMRKEEAREKELRRKKERGMGSGKYQMLRRRQVKIETEAWDHVAKEYRSF